MIKFEDLEVVGWKAALRGMRNPWESSDKADTVFLSFEHCEEPEDFKLASQCAGKAPIIGPNDRKLMKQLSSAGTDHRKFMRMLTIYVDITAPLYWWKEFETYKVGTVSNSTSTMHTIHKNHFSLLNFSCEHLNSESIEALSILCNKLNEARDAYIETSDKECWWQIIQLLPSSFNQKRTIMLNYEVLANIYKSRKNHKLDEWRKFCDWIVDLPYSEIITLK